MKTKSTQAIVELVPNKSIGAVSLGTKAADLPKQAKVQGPGGELEGIRFLLNETGSIEDIWIDDLRTFAGILTYQGQTIPRDATVETLETLFGKCQRVPGVKGAIYYNCAAGIALGTDFSRRTLQVRVKPR